MTLAERLAQRHATILATEEAVRDRWRFRVWYRQTARELFGERWNDLLTENDRELRRLIRRLRRMRAAAWMLHVRGLA